MATPSAQKIIGKEELVHLTAAKTDLSLRETQQTLDALLATIEEQVAKGHQVRIIGFGTWKTRPISARTIKSIRGGQPVHLPAGQRVSFSTGSHLAQAATPSPKTGPSKKAQKK
jgi:DNA-binding protein HU-beta